MVAPALFSSAHTEWATPRDLAAALVTEHGITTDVCADAGNAVVPRFFAKEDDGLAQRWEGVCWMNPPFGKDIGIWVAKAAQHARDGDALVVCLLPVRSDTRWWHASVWDAHRHRPQRGVEIRFLNGIMCLCKGPESTHFSGLTLNPKRADFEPLVNLI